MRPIASVHALLAALCLSAPVAGLCAPGGQDDFHGRHPGPGYHGRYLRHGPRFFYGGAPVFWGPAIGFSFYGAPAYYPGYDSQESPDRPTYRGEQRTETDAKDGRDDLGMDLQRALAHEGYYHGPIDGEIGSGSRAAIRAYQSDHGMEPTGRMDSGLLRSLHIE